MYFASTVRPFCVAGAYVDETAVSIAAAVSCLLVTDTIAASCGVPSGAIVSRTTAVPVWPMASRDEPRFTSRGGCTEAALVARGAGDSN